jgi:hypothetical protein
MERAMTPAELKTLRESLGLPVAWLAQRAAVHDRSVRYWESGHAPVPDDVAQLMTSLEATAWDVVLGFSKEIKETPDAVGGLPEEVVLLRYKTDEDLWAFHPDFKGLPVTFHASILSRVRRLLWEYQIPSVIEFMDPRAYREWLAGRVDSEDLRVAWAGSLKVD